jgi:hypothetical protein
MENVRVVPLVLSWLGMGCFAPTAQPGAPCGEGGVCPSGLVCSAEGRCERTLTDAAVADTSIVPDTVADACVGCPTLIARYHFDGNLADELGSLGGMGVGDGLTFVSGSVGQAVRIPTTATSYIRVADSPALDLTSGEIELRFRFDATAVAGDLGLISRDATGTATDGHFNLRIGHDRRVVLRIQRMSDPSESVFRCTADPVAVDVWHTISATFGPDGLGLKVDGVSTNGTSWVDADGVTVDCTVGWDRGIAGNDNPLILGALTVLSTEPTGMPATNVAGGVDLDEVVVWSSDSVR